MSIEKKEKRNEKTNNKIEMQDLFKLGTIKKFNLKKFISKELLKKLEKRYGQVLIPYIGLALHDKKNLILFLHPTPEDAEKEKQVIVLHSKDLSEKDLNELIDIIEKQKD